MASSSMRVSGPSDVTIDPLPPTLESPVATIKALAHASGSGCTFVGQLERGERGASLKTLFSLSKVLGVEPSEIVRMVVKDLKA
jgi:transcriptional regulator with XRE-family HTH domain